MWQKINEEEVVGEASVLPQSPIEKNGDVGVMEVYSKLRFQKAKNEQSKTPLDTKPSGVEELVAGAVCDMTNVQLLVSYRLAKQYIFRAA